MKKRKLISLLTILVLCMQLVLPAFASEVSSEPQTMEETQSEPASESVTESQPQETMEESIESTQESVESETVAETTNEEVPSQTEENEPVESTELSDETEDLPDLFIGQALNTGIDQSSDVTNALFDSNPNLGIAAAAIGNLPTTFAISDDALLKLQVEMLIYINALRLRNGVDAVALNVNLNQAAMIRAKECSITFQDDHARPDGRSCFTVLTDLGIPYYSAGENIAYGYPDVLSVMQGWWSSNGHRENILSPAYQLVGIGYYNDGTHYSPNAPYSPYWTQDFTGGYGIADMDFYANSNKFKVGSSLEESGIVIEITYSNGMIGILPLMNEMVSGYNPNQLGAQTIVVTCQGISYELDIEVIDPVRDFVTRLYTQVLNRQPDPSGLTAWTDVLKSGKEQGAKVAQGFIASKELAARNLSDRDYVTMLYRTFFDREPDPSGLQAWIGELDKGLSRLHVFKGFAESVEFTKICDNYGIKRGNAELTEPRDQKEGVTKFVARCYKLCLGRKADPDGLNAWCQQILTGKNTAKEAAHGFVFSEEFKKKNLSDTDYVKVLYQVFMDRDADSSGLNAWVKVLQSGKDREHVFNGFADSVEFKKICDSFGIK